MFLDFILMSIISILAIVISSLISYEILHWTRWYLPRIKFARHLRVLVMLAPIFAVHIINIWLYASIYFLIENFSHFGVLIGDISQASLSYETFIERLYFSASTYTSLGFGEIVPTSNLRMLTSAEVLNGLVMIGWTISFTYLIMENTWLRPNRKRK